VQRSIVRSLAVLGLSATVASSAFAQAVPNERRPMVDLTPYVGYLNYGTLFDGPLGTSVSNANTALYGAQLGLRVTPTLSLVGNIGYASSDLQANAPIIGGFGVADSRTLVYDGGVELALPLPQSTTVRPFVGAGAGAIRYEAERAGFKTNSTNFAWNVGGGLDFQFSPSLGARLMVRDYVGKLDVKEAVGFDFESKTAHNIGFSLGLKLSF
jgi:opacity protein-like surface antigen